MTTAIKRRRGTTTQHSTFTGLEGELTVDTTKDTVVVHDGAAAGGYPLLREDLANNTNVTTNAGTQTLTNKTISGSNNTLSNIGNSSLTNSGITFGSTSQALGSTVSALNGVSIGASTASTGAFTSLSDSGNLTFTGTGNRITGDFSNATLANRVMFQTNTVNGSSDVGVIPNGTGTFGTFRAFGGSDPSNSQWATMFCNGGSEVRFTSSYSGTPASGTYLPMTFYTGGSERVRVDTSGNVGIGTSSPVGKLHLNAATESALRITSDLTGASSTDGLFFGLNNNGTDATLWNFENGYLRIATNNTERMRIDSSGNVLVTNPAGLGYGTGSGGTVTQATNKSTAVTLNKPTGQITMNNAALAANAIARFTFNDSLITTTDNIILSLVGGVASVSSYRYWIDGIGSGNCGICVQNITAGSLSEAVVFNFAVIKGATA